MHSNAPIVSRNGAYLVSSDLQVVGNYQVSIFKMLPLNKYKIYYAHSIDLKSQHYASSANIHCTFVDQPAFYVYHGSNFVFIPRVVELIRPAHYRRTPHHLFGVYPRPHFRFLLQQHMRRALVSFAGTYPYRGVLRRD